MHELVHGVKDLFLLFECNGQLWEQGYKKECFWTFISEMPMAVGAFDMHVAKANG